MKTPLNTTQPMLTATQAAKCIGIGRSTFYDWLERGALPYHRIGRLIRIHPDDLARFIDSTRMNDFAGPTEYTAQSENGIHCNNGSDGSH